MEDNAGRITGHTSGGIKEEIPNILYDVDTSKNADILFPQEDYIIRVIGTESGPYNLYEVRGATDGTLLEFHAQDIPLTIGEVHEYHIHFNPDTKQITSELRIDQDGDGKYERTVNGGALLTLSGNAKIQICHNASKNNPHEISVAEPAVKAHLAHGDILGACPALTPSPTVQQEPSNKKGGKKK